MTALTRSDSEIKNDILTELKWDPEISDTDVGIEVDDGIVTLTGTVDSFAKKAAAERAAQRVRGVRAIAEEIQINVYSGGLAKDTDLASWVVAALESEEAIPSNKIDVKVENGRVTLSGSVDWQYQRVYAEDVVRRIRGVTKIHNRLTINQPAVSSAEIRAAIKDAFERHARIDAEKVSVAIDEDGHATLSGSVGSWEERQQAAEVAWRARGVRSVTNQIKVGL